MKITENNIFSILTKGSCILLVLMTAAGFILGSQRIAIGILAGGLIAVVNAYWLHYVLKRAMRLPAKKGVRFTQVRYFLRLAVIAVVVSALIVYWNISPLGLLLGLSVLVINIMGLTIYITFKGGSSQWT